MRSRRFLLVPCCLLLLAACADDADEPASGSREAFCAELRTAVQDDLTVFDPVQPVSPQETGAATARLAEAAPSDVSAEMALLAETFVAVAEVLEDVDPSDPEAAERLGALSIDQEEIAAAQQAVTGYARDECRIDIAAINAASMTTTSTTVVPPSTTSPTTVPPVEG